MNPLRFFEYSICNQHIAIFAEQTAIDRFSAPVENYKDLVNGLQGVSKSNGLEFRSGTSFRENDIYGVVNYIAANSDAATKDIQRGDIFIAVDGTLYSNIIILKTITSIAYSTIKIATR